jgi:CHAT domain-containing protein
LQLWDVTRNTTPRVTWCATGPLAFLPLHAAGIYGNTAGKNPIKASDFVVSSYTPSLAALIRPRRNLPHQKPPQIMMVSQPATPNHNQLPGTIEEARIVKKHFPDQVYHLDHTDATVAAVLAALDSDQHNWLHLACHGIQDTADPTQSAFALHDGMLPLSALMARPLAHAELAVLSACQTATGDVRLAEESVHLAGGMLGAGFRSVVGTLWSIGDADATVVVDEFYSCLKREYSEGLEEIRPAYALHRAVERLREEVGEEDFVRWVPYVYFGQ